LAGTDPEEIAINRNASEGLETIVFGLPLKAGDEVVASRQDYPNMVNAYKQREIKGRYQNVLGGSAPTQYR
jgi:selenocysteine lyase/cysteine desulfurase